jgi:hypothetical protein
MKKLIALIAHFFILAMPGNAGDHDYFNWLISRPEHWKSYSLRSQAQIDQYSGGDGSNPWVTYNPAADTHPTKQDAAKVVIPDFLPQTTLTSAMDGSQTTISVESTSGWLDKRGLRVDNEVMRVVSVEGNTAVVTRGYYGTPITAHAAGTTVYRNSNSLPRQVWMPMNTENGHTYLTTWDAWYTDEMRASQHGVSTWKTYQFRATSNPKIWFEVRTVFSRAPTVNDVAKIDVRGYCCFGPNVTGNEPLTPMVGEFIIRPGTWVRYWQLTEQRADGHEYMSLWIADETHGPVQLLDRLLIEAGPGIAHVDLEFNTSTDRMLSPINRPPLVIYVKNFAILRDVANIWPLLQKPGTTSPAPHAPIIQTQPGDRNVVAGSTVSFTASAIGTMPMQYQWQIKRPGSAAFTAIAGAVFGGLVYGNVPLAEHNSEIRCVISNAIGTVISEAATLGVFASNPPSTTPPPPPPPPSGTPPPPPPASGVLGAPTLSLPEFLPVNSHITAGYSGATPAYFSWSFTPMTTPPAAVGGGAAAGMTAHASAASFNTPSPVANLTTAHLDLGTYLITVRAHNASGTSSLAASAQVTLVSANLDQVRVYPNPWRSDRHGTRSITFDNLTVNTEIKIFTTSGHHVKTLPISNSQVTWDLKNESGEKVASGIYMYILKADDGSKKTGKVVVIK